MKLSNSSSSNLQSFALLILVLSVANSIVLAAPRRQARVKRSAPEVLFDDFSYADGCVASMKQAVYVK